MKELENGFEMKSEIKTVLEKIEFVNRHKVLS